MENEKGFDPIRSEFMLSGVEDFLPLASAAKAMYEAFMKCGFPENKAFELTKAWMIQMCANMKGRTI